MNGTSRPAIWALVILTVAYVLSFVDRQILALLIEPLRHDLAITDFQASLLQGLAFAGIYVLAGLPLGWAADRGNRRYLMVAGVLVWSAMTSACGFARQYWTLFLGRTGVGIGEATLSPCAYAMLTDYFPPRQLTRAMAFYNLGPAIGSGLSYFLGGTVLAMVGQSTLVSMGPLGLMRPWQVTFIVIGALGLPVALLLYTVREPARRMLIATAETSANLADCWRYLWRRRQELGNQYLGMAIISIGNYATMAWYPTMYVRSFGLSLSSVGVVFGAVYVVASVLGNVVGGWGPTALADRGVREANLRWMQSVWGLALVLGVVAPLLPTPTGRYAMSAGLIMVQNTWMAAGVARMHVAVPATMRAQLTAILLLGTNIVGLVLGPSGVAALTDWVFGDPQALNRSLAIVCGASALVGWWLIRRSRQACLAAQPAEL